MRILILMAMLFVASAVQANAQVVPFDYNGITASYNTYGNDAADGNAEWYSGGGEQISPSFDGALGAAQQFTITVPTLISALDTSAYISSGNPQVGLGQNISTTVNWEILSGSTGSYLGGYYFPNELIPDSNGEGISGSDFATATYTISNDGTNQIVNEQLAFDADLQPGTYWVVETGTGDAAVSLSQTYNDPAVGAAPVPEPPTFWLFIIAAIGFILLKRKNDIFGHLV